MKFINKVVIFVMGVVVIGVVATTIGVVTRSKTVEKSVTFELLENGELAFNVYDKIEEYVVFDENNDDNVVSITVNNTNMITLPTIGYFNDYYLLYDGHDDDPELEIYNNSTYIIQNGVNVGDIITITFEVEQETPVIIKTLLFLIPLVLSASLIGYLAFRKGENL